MPSSSLVFSEERYIYVPTTSLGFSHIAATGTTLSDVMYMSPHITPPVLKRHQWLLSGTGIRRGYIGAAQLLPVALPRKHLPQIADVGGSFILRQIRAGNFLRFFKMTAQADH